MDLCLKGRRVEFQKLAIIDQFGYTAVFDGIEARSQGHFAKAVVVTAYLPHGIRYSLTLHDHHGTRVLGYDNAHAVKPPKKFKFAGQRLPFDHRHRTPSDQGIPYAFESAQQLLEDFFAEVDHVIKELQT